MKEIEFSVMADSAAAIQPLLNQFTAEHQVRVRLRLLAWDTAWPDLVNVAFHGRGPDLSEIGSTWLGDFIAMNALRPFSDPEVAALGGAEGFLPTAWRGVHLIGQPDTWAIPWFGGARLLFYRRNLLQQAGLDEHTAFQTANQLDRILAQLQAAGVSIPWIAPTAPTHATLLNLASWVWEAGGDFISPDGRRTLLNQPETRAGLRAYFALGRFLAPEVRRLNDLEADRQFLHTPEAAMTISGSWLFDQAEPGLKEQLGVALPPGASFVGGSHLVVWQHTLHPEPALQLIRFLTRPSVQVAYSQRVGLLPAVLEALRAPPYATDPWWQVVRQGVQTGRTFPATRAWGVIEDHLAIEFGELWNEVLTTPQLNLDAAIARRVEPLASRLDLALEQA